MDRVNFPGSRLVRYGDQLARTLSLVARRDCWIVVLLAAIASTSNAWSADAQWIWCRDHEAGSVPAVSCYFRKSFELQSPLEGQITIAADDSYEISVNGRQVGQGQFAKGLKQIDVGSYLRSGRNIVAVRVTNVRGPTAALAARVLIRQNSGWSAFSTDASWKTELHPLPFWKTTLYNDRQWSAARVHGPLGETSPWDRPQQVAVEESHRSKRFTISDEFAVHRVADGETSGSLIAMTFNEFGHVITSRENGPLLLMYDEDGDNRLEQSKVYCDQVKNCQGILALNGDVFVTGEGPSGHGLYRLVDTKREGMLDEVRLLFKFNGVTGEHAAHGLVLGPDGMIYVVLGNHVRPDVEYHPDSPHRNYYEGDLLKPRYEDPAGHAVGMKTPGGVVIRTDVEGRKVELVAGGLRNAYDLAFNREGELFVHDSDMESDVGSTWYRPTRVFHVVPGGEYGWRSGWAKWPDYYVDNLPAVVDTGRGSPTGAVIYNHYAFPARYHNVLFTADWSQGRILAVRMKPDGSTYRGDSEVFLQGQPLNVTDLEIGSDGALYFCTGGRGTAGGIYRVSWSGNVPESVSNRGKGIVQVIRQPHVHSAWSRQYIAGKKQEQGENWTTRLNGVAFLNTNKPAYRTRALDVMQLFGPQPESSVLMKLAKSPSEEVRAKAAELLGINGGPESAEVLIGLLADSDRRVRRRACESLFRMGELATFEELQPLLESDDRFEAWAARQLLQRLPVDQWRGDVLASDNIRLLIQGGLAMMQADPSEENTQALIGRVQEVMFGFISDRNFVDLLRVVQVALHRGKLPTDVVERIREQVADEFPAGHAVMNRELVRILIYLQADSILDRYLAYLESDVETVEKMHLAFHLRFLKKGWTTGQRMQVLEVLEEIQNEDRGNSVPFYVQNVVRDFVAQLSDEDALAIFARGEELPTAALGALYRLPDKLDEDLRTTLIELDERLVDRRGDAVARLQTGLVAVLAQAGDAVSQEYLRQVWEQSPERRSIVAMGLAQTPSERNWDYLVRSLPVLDGELALEVLQKLREIDRRGETPEHYRQVILRGLALEEEGAVQAVKLLEQWTDETRGEADADSTEKLAAWQTWFAEFFPDHPAAELPKESKDSKWEFTELLEQLEGKGQPDGTGKLVGSAQQGEAVYAKATCIKCHRHGELGEPLGPDLTDVHRRFTRREILESILFPSHVVSSQYASKTIVTSRGRTYTGLVIAGVGGEKTILQSNGNKVTVPGDEIEEVRADKVSSMPAGLLDQLTLQEVADLFAFLQALPRSEVAERRDGAAIR